LNPTCHPRSIRHRSRLAARVVGLALGVGAFGSAASAQSVPAARLLPARPIDESAVPVQRSATPDYSTPSGYKFDVPGSVPAPSYGGRSTGVPAANTQPTLEKPKGVISGAISGVKDLFGGKPAEPTNPRPNPAVVMQQPAPQPAPGLYAGPPAYRWYGYGSPTPGANPYAPTGLSPRASANWYSQTGATPGAFPVPVTAMPRQNSHEPPAYVGPMYPEDAHYLAGTRIPTYTPVPTPANTTAGNRVLAQSQTPRSTEPQMPSGSGWPVVGETDPTPSNGDISWQPVNARHAAPIATTPAAQPTNTSPPPADPSWGPSNRGLPAQSAPAPSVSMIRGQAPTEEKIDLDGVIRSACYGRASGVSVTSVGVKKLHVKLVSPTESDARDAAAVVSRLPQLKAYTITFEATVER
jgi:hypothetical protein